MPFGIRLHDIPGRLATGAYILNSGLTKRRADADTAAGLHGTAAQAFPFLGEMPPAKFVRVLSKAEVATGAVLLAPFVPTVVAGAALTAFSGGLVTMYLRSPDMREPGSLRPAGAGTAIAKDSWMLGMGLGFLIDSIGRVCRRR